MISQRRKLDVLNAANDKKSFYSRHGERRFDQHDGDAAALIFYICFCLLFNPAAEVWNCINLFLLTERERTLTIDQEICQ